MIQSDFSGGGTGFYEDLILDSLLALPGSTHRGGEVMDEFMKKWESVLPQLLPVAIVNGLALYRKEHADELEEEQGPFTKGALKMLEDLMELPWEQIRYIIKRKL